MQFQCSLDVGWYCTCFSWIICGWKDPLDCTLNKPFLSVMFKRFSDINDNEGGFNIGFRL